VFDRVIGIIPAHLESIRLPRKPLRPICGIPMIAWVYHRARRSHELSQLLVATDSKEIFAYCRENGIEATMTSTRHRSGTERVLEVMAQQSSAGRATSLFVNIQGDEPMVTPEHIALLVRPFREDPSTCVSTLKVAISAGQAQDPNNVKVVTDGQGRALYFSRAPIPLQREGAGAAPYYKHLGLYAYSAAALGKFQSFPPSTLEQTERLEQLRFLENGIPITVVETSGDTIGVDTEEDLNRVEEYFRRTGATLSGDDRSRRR